jgi:hypothetical protein
MKVILIVVDSVAGAFTPLMSARSLCMKRAIEELGHQVQVVTGEDALKNPARAARTIARFNPDFVTCASFNHLLHVAQNEHLLHLDVPTVGLWDDPLGALASTVLCYSPKELPEPRRDRIYRTWESLCGLKEKLFGYDTADPRENLTAPQAFRKLLSNPYWLHVAWDSGHAEAFTALGLATPNQVSWHPVATYPAFLAMGEKASDIQPNVEVGFCGNLYLASLQSSRFWTDPFYRGMCRRVVTRKLREPAGSGWDFMLEEIAAARPSLRRRIGLYPQMREFWEFYTFLLWSVLTTLPRVDLLDAVDREVTLFGLFADPATRKALAGHSNLKFGGNLDHFEELPRQFAATAVNICPTNGLIYRGTPSKLIDCLASGGFALSEPKADLVRLFGPKVTAIFFHSPEELREKVNYYLDRPGERREIVEALRVDIKQRCTLTSLFSHVVQTVRSAQRPPARAAA